MVDGSLPEGYGETRIVLLPVDPYRVHVYWEVSGSDRRRLKAHIEDGSLRPQPVLRFHDVTALPAGGVLASGSFDVKIAIESGNWYVHLIRPERAYVVDLGFRRTEGLFHRIARSNREETPRAWPHEEARPQRMRVVQADRAVLADHLEESPAVGRPEAVSEASGNRPRVEMVREGPRAAVGMASIPAVTAHADKIPDTGPADRPTESPREGGIRRMWKEPGTKKTRSVPTAETKGKEWGPLQIRSSADASENLKTQVTEIYEHRNTKVDLSILCDYLFVSGLSSGEIVQATKREDTESV
jgi:hypothetical protein